MTHPDLPTTESDPNAYTLGRVGAHNVVIACLPDGEYGNNPAASVAAWMVASFPKVRVGLLVGIGAGIPPQVQLGDIVVSSPGSSYPGVVQWDMGKAEDGGVFRHAGSLNKPPTELSTVVSKLRSLHRMNGSSIQDILLGVERRFSRLKPQYTRPPSITNTPIPSGSVVLHGRDLIVGQNATELSSNELPSTTIHCGLIASGNSVIKDAALRDKINECFNGQMLCTEMEAAGLKDNFPCLVIRDICDHADHNKTDEWQEYAATVASAYGKEILRRPGKTQSAYLAKALQGTGQWLLNETKYTDWRENPGETLFCPGIPGAGKTFLTSIVIDHLENFMVDKDAGIAYVYCIFQPEHEQSAQGFLASILEQLVRRRPLLSERLRPLHEKHDRRGTQHTLQEIYDILENVVRTYSRVFILIDALDEYQENRRPGDNWQIFIDEIFNLKSKTRANVFATSRFIPSIIERFQNKTTVEITARDEDLYKYIDQNMPRLPRFVPQRDRIQDGVRDWVLKSTDGM
ncbi:hypothetical protein ACHAPU_001037 [Fusarium lateritium]